MCVALKHQLSFLLSCLTGRKTFPSRSRRPQLSPSMMNRDDYSPHGSEHSLSKSSSSSGIGADYDTIDSRRRRDSELEHSIKSLQEMSIKEGAKCETMMCMWNSGLGQNNLTLALVSGPVSSLKNKLFCLVMRAMQSFKYHLLVYHLLSFCSSNY